MTVINVLLLAVCQCGREDGKVETETGTVAEEEM